MGIFDSLIGNSSEVSLEELQEEWRELLADSEVIEKGYRILRDTFIFTNKRLILIDKQGVMGGKQEYLSIPYKNINRFSIETAGTFDLEAELKIWLSGTPMPIQKNFNRSTNVYELQRVLANYVL